jgi:hypothetical protein
MVSFVGDNPEVDVFVPLDTRPNNEVVRGSDPFELTLEPMKLNILLKISPNRAGLVGELVYRGVAGETPSFVNCWISWASSKAWVDVLFVGSIIE